jgi:hypothetical protein
MAPSYNGSDGRSIGQLVSDLFRQISFLIQEEIALARTEMSVKLPTVGRSVGMIAGGGALVYAGVLALIAALIIGVHAVLPWWASALLVGLVVLAIGVVLIQLGLQTIKHANLAPRRTVASLRGYRDINQPTALSRRP